MFRSSPCHQQGKCYGLVACTISYWLPKPNCTFALLLMWTFTVLFQYMPNKTQRYTVYYIWKLLYMFRVVPPPSIRSANSYIYIIWYLSHRYCYLPLAACRAVSRYNKLCSVASCWIYIGIFLRCTDQCMLNLQFYNAVICTLYGPILQIHLQRNS
jgi:hypothetical protein